MPISNTVREALVSASSIRQMFEQALRLKAEVGEDKVADLSLGNPVVEPPPEVVARLKALADDPTPGTHRYMQNAGLPGPRRAVAKHLSGATGVPYAEEHIVMTVGAGGGLNVVLKAILDPGDEVIVLTPFFVEYPHYLRTFAAKTVLVETDARFRPDAARIAEAMTPRTRAVIVNSPNNPTGVVYDASDFDALADVLRAGSARQGRPIYLLSDEPYRAISYDGVDVPWPVRHYAETIHVTSFSKDLALPGERIGYIAVNPDAEGSGELHRALTYGMRALGFVNAPALQQRLVEGLVGVHLDTSAYAAKRHRLLDALEANGYELVRPDGAFYMFPRTPGGMDDLAFVEACIEERFLVVPGSAFGCAKHFRMSYAVRDHDIDLAVEALARVKARVG